MHSSSRTFACALRKRTSMNPTTFSKTPPVFFQRLREVTEAYFKENNLRKTGDGRLYWKTGILMTALVSLYVVLVFFTPSNGWVSLGLCSLLGVVVASIGFNVMHDGAHGSYSRRKWVNEMMGHSLNMLGGSVYFWKQKHNVNHHTFTNIEGMDEDIDIKFFMRVHKGQPKHWFHRFQHIYGLLLYGLTYLFWITLNDMQKYFTGKIGENTVMKPLSVKEHVIFWATKVGYFALFVVLPMFFAGVVPTLIGYGVMVFVTVCKNIFDTTPRPRSPHAIQPARDARRVRLPGHGHAGVHHRHAGPHHPLQQRVRTGQRLYLRRAHR